MKTKKTQSRRAELRRTTAETDVRVVLDLDGSGDSRVATGVRFLDHMLTALARHSRIDLELAVKGDVEVDDHHTVEDAALALGAALDRALGDRGGIGRFGWAYAPLDEALARAVVDLSGRPFAAISLGLERGTLGTLACENVGHVLSSLATAARATLHVDVLKGHNDHHRAEAAFKALALALRQAVERTAGDEVPSTKGAL